MTRQYEATDVEESEQWFLCRTIKEALGGHWCEPTIKMLWSNNFEIAFGDNKYVATIDSLDDHPAVFETIISAVPNLYYEPEEAKFGSFNKLKFCELTTNKDGNKLIVQNAQRQFVFRSPIDAPMLHWIRLPSLFLNSDTAYSTVFVSHFLSVKNSRPDLSERYLCILSDLVKISPYGELAQYCAGKCLKFF